MTPPIIHIKHKQARERFFPRLFVLSACFSALSCWDCSCPDETAKKTLDRPQNSFYTLSQKRITKRRTGKVYSLAWVQRTGNDENRSHCGYRMGLQAKERTFEHGIVFLISRTLSECPPLLRTGYHVCSHCVIASAVHRYIDDLAMSNNGCHHRTRQWESIYQRTIERNIDDR